MKKIVEKNKCTGCTACQNVCPKNAIKMVENFEGFKYPIIDQNKCINCGLCKKTCPVLNTKSNYSMNKCFVGYAKNSEYRINSSSGGIFTIIANYFLENNGIVIGATFTEQKKLKHVAITDKKDLNKLKGSKYLQSDLESIFKYVKDELSSHKVLFVGTPCQVAGLKAYIKNDNSNLFCIDLICHGVPSQKLFSKYISELEEKNNDKITNYNFRDKKTGWESYSNTITFKDKIISEVNYDNEYMKIFLSNIALRNSCYNCNFKLGNKYSDITLGDFWGIKKFHPEMYNKEGVSAIIINTEKGLSIFDLVNKNLNYKECEISEILSENSSLNYSSEIHSKRDAFFEELDTHDITSLSRKYTSKPLYTRIIKKIKRYVKKIIKLK